MVGGCPVRDVHSLGTRITQGNRDRLVKRAREIPVKEYDNLYKQFDPVKFNADEWVGVAKEAGMKYIVLTSKHHDGFCLWNTRQTDYNIMNSPFGRDVVKELSRGLPKTGDCFWHILFYLRLGIIPISP